MEDIHQMRTQCVTENMIVFVDSSLRDRHAHPTPAEYVVHFQQPFANVMGVEVLDAAIPRTMYVVDSHNNHVRVITPSAPRDVYLEPRDYTINELFTELRDKFAEVGITVTHPSTDIKWTSLLHFYAARPFTLDMDSSTAREVLGFDQYARTDAVPAPPGRYVARGTGRMYGAERMDDTPASLLVTFADEPATLGDATMVELSTVSGERWDLDLTHRASLTSARTYKIGLIAVPLYAREADPATAEVTAEVQYDGEGDAPAYDAEIVTATAFAALIRDLGYGAIAFPTAPTDPPLTPFHFLVLKHRATADNDRRGLERQLSTATTATWSVTCAAPTAFEIVRVSTYVPSVVMLTPHLYTVHAPGMISLVGERYVLLRCKEIDENAQIGYAYMNTSPGIALFKLGVMGYADIRLDFASIRYKEFHPIGKLSKLTLRFETLGGAAYDFKGVNHHMLLVIKYYVPSAGRAWTPVLNPSYDPDLTRYRFEHRDHTDEDDSSLDDGSSDG